MPKAAVFKRQVAAQLQTGWSIGRYGITEDVVTRIDRVSLWTLTSALEALNESGFTDSYELYERIHQSEVGTSMGSGTGCAPSMAKMFKYRRDAKDGIG